MKLSQFISSEGMKLPPDFRGRPVNFSFPLQHMTLHKTSNKDTKVQKQNESNCIIKHIERILV